MGTWGNSNGILASPSPITTGAGGGAALADATGAALTALAGAWGVCGRSTAGGVRSHAVLMTQQRVPSQA